MTLINPSSPIVILDARTCAWLERYAGLSSLRVKVRGTDSEISEQLTEIRLAALAWRSSATGTIDDTKAEPAAESEQWLSTGQAADLAGVTSRAIRKAIAETRLPAVVIGGRHRISREDLEHYKAARAA